ncbi:hypothetical protein C4552_00785 [Candidatus Parcubacteria bacterium]|nr:MAG: hypothetical protein C4552_00785 [Candidatus Parcubacteria bacterium]
MISMLFFMAVSLAIIFGIAVAALRETRIAHTNHDARRSYYLAEAAIEDALYRVQASKPFDANETITIGGFSSTVAITGDGDGYTLEAEGDIDSAIRRISVILENGIGASFTYGAHVGWLGMDLNNSGARIVGSVYSNGLIHGENGPRFTGDAWVASNADPSDQKQLGQSSSTDFRRASANMDFAQSFVPSLTAYPKELRIWLRKVGSPSNNVSVKIREDSGQKPYVGSGALEFGNGSFSPNDVGCAAPADFCQLTIALSNINPLIEGTKYWFVLDGSAFNASNYFEIALHTDGSYSDGTAMLSGDWQSGTWAGLSADAKFDLHLEIDQNRIEGENNNGIIVEGDVHAYEIDQNVKICGNGYYTLIEGTPTTGSLGFLNDPDSNTCAPPLDTDGTPFPSSPTPEPVDLPLTLETIGALVERADSGDIIPGLTLQNGQTRTFDRETKIEGDLRVESNAVLTLNGDIHITGQFTCDSGTVRLDPAFDSGSGVIIVDDRAVINNQCDLIGSGHQDSYVMILSRAPVRESGNAIHLRNLSNALTKVIAYAHFGDVLLENNLTIHQVTGVQIRLQNSAEVVYESGLANVSFTSGPTGGWVVQQWREIE